MAAVFFMLLLVFLPIAHSQDGEQLTLPSQNTTASFNDDCVAVQAVKELHCPLLKKYHLFPIEFLHVCERHQLCYACGSIHGVTARECNILAKINLFRACSQLNQSSSISACLTRAMPTFFLLRRRHVYHTTKNNLGLPSECSRKCVLDYFYAE